MSLCRSCGAPIVWAKTEGGKAKGDAGVGHVSTNVLETVKL